MIVVSAATGAYGRLVVDRLLDRLPAAQVAVAVRDVAKAQDLAERGVDVRYGDYDDLDGLRRAFEDADRLLFISGHSDGSGERVEQHQRVIDAARDAGVGHIAYTSGLGADFVEEGLLGEHRATERALDDSGVPYSALRHPIYSDFFINPWLVQAVEAGELTSSTQGRGMNTAFRSDLAEAAATLLCHRTPPRTSYDFTGPMWTYPQLATVLSTTSGRPVPYRETEADTDEGFMAMIGPIIRAGGFELQTGDLETVLGRPATDLQHAVTRALQPVPA